jgi:hypothetical protein
MRKKPVPLLSLGVNLHDASELAVLLEEGGLSVEATATPPKHLRGHSAIRAPRTASYADRIAAAAPLGTAPCTLQQSVIKPTSACMAPDTLLQV